MSFIELEEFEEEFGSELVKALEDVEQKII
jgi:hypothetical protein